MANAIFDGLPELFVETFGERDGVIYTPIATGVPLDDPLDAILIDDPLDVVIGEQVGGDDVRKTLHMRTADVAEPAEGDLAEIDGVTWTVVPPFKPDGKGMVSVTLARRS